MHDRRKPYRLTHTPRPCLRTPRPAARVLRGACSEAAAWAAWHRCRARVEAWLAGEQARGGALATPGVYRLVGPEGEMARIEVAPRGGAAVAAGGAAVAAGGGIGGRP